MMNELANTVRIKPNTILADGEPLETHSKTGSKVDQQIISRIIEIFNPNVQFSSE